MKNFSGWPEYIPLFIRESDRVDYDNPRQEGAQRDREECQGYQQYAGLYFTLHILIICCGSHLRFWGCHMYIFYLGPSFIL